MKQEINIEDLSSSYQVNGIIKIKSLFSKEHIEEIKTELNRYVNNDLASMPSDTKTFEIDGKTVRNLWRLEKHNQYFNNLGQIVLNHPLIPKLVKGKPVLVGIETFNKPAFVGSGAPLHQDNSYFCQTPSDVLTLWVAIDAATLENGPVYFLKGSYKNGILPAKPSGISGNSIGIADFSNFDISNFTPELLAPGDATIHHCETIHYSGPNKSKFSRLALLFVFRGSHTRPNKDLSEKYSMALKS